MIDFLPSEERKLCDEFLENGIVKVTVESVESLRYLHDSILAEWENPDLIHEIVTSAELNRFRMDHIKSLNSSPQARMHYYACARNILHTLVGNELVMQKNINLSIQMPGDQSSLLPIHADVLQGDSPYEVVLWIPLVDVYDTKSMFFARKHPVPLGDLGAMYVECDPYFVECKYGECLVFSPNWMHGNMVNQTKETRWSMNCRFKSALTPYADKKLGEFFLPITTRPVTKIGMKYEYPTI